MRFTITIALVAASFALLTCWAIDLAESCGASLFPHLRAQMETVDRARQDRDTYALRLADVVSDLNSGRMSLREASRAVEEYAVEHYPALLGHVDLMSDGLVRSRPREVRIAFMLLHHCDEKTAGPERFAQLRRELEAWAAAQ